MYYNISVTKRVLRFCVEPYTDQLDKAIILPYANYPLHLAELDDEVTAKDVNCAGIMGETRADP
ncbi:MAG: hypothetical protein SOI23_05090 [Atopobiaceae bacterium]|jgi:hypothetical protein